MGCRNGDVVDDGVFDCYAADVLKSFFFDDLGACVSGSLIDRTILFVVTFIVISTVVSVVSLFVSGVGIVFVAVVVIASVVVIITAAIVLSVSVLVICRTSLFIIIFLNGSSSFGCFVFLRCDVERVYVEIYIIFFAVIKAEKRMLKSGVLTGDGVGTGSGIMTDG